MNDFENLDEAEIFDEAIRALDFYEIFGERFQQLRTSVIRAAAYHPGDEEQDIRDTEVPPEFFRQLGHEVYRAACWAVIEEFDRRRDQRDEAQYQRQHSAAALG